MFGVLGHQGTTMEAQIIKAGILTIGDELLIGQVVDTNSAWMAQRLNEVGIRVGERQSVGDVYHDIWQALDALGAKFQVVLITGGLGPTADDITKPLLCTYFGGTMVVDAGALANVTAIFERLGRPLIERNLKQAEVPDVCRVLQNARGTAPGMWFEKGGTIFVSMPGVPHEMKGMMEKDVLPALHERFGLAPVIHRTLLTAGQGESFLAEAIQHWEAQLPAYIKLAYLPNYGMVRLRLSASGEVEAEVEAQFEQLKQLVAPWLVTDRDETIQMVVGRLLLERGATLATAESCTGGYIAHLITSLPGSSNWYLGSVVSYDNTVKHNLLHVPATILEEHGAVSMPVVETMVQGAQQTIGSTYAVAVSGIMGPHGGTADKPVGTVWIAAAGKGQLVSRKFHFRFDRQRNIELTAAAALNLVRTLVLES